MKRTERWPADAGWHPWRLSLALSVQKGLLWCEKQAFGGGCSYLEGRRPWERVIQIPRNLCQMLPTNFAVQAQFVLLQARIGR